MLSKQAGRTKLRKLERDIQKSITDWLDLLGLEYTVTDAGKTVGKDESGQWVVKAHSKVKKSWPDITILLPVSYLPGRIWGLMLVVEVKTPAGRYQPGQKEHLERMNQMGALGITARNLDDLIAYLNSPGIRAPFLRGLAEVDESLVQRAIQLLSLPPELD